MLFALALATTTAANAQSAAPLAIAERVADWQLAHRNDDALLSRLGDETRDPAAWEQAAFWIGLTDLADHDPRAKRFADTLLAMGKAQGWRPGPRPYHADDQAIAQAYLWMARRGAGAAAIVPTRAQFDKVLAAPPRVSLAFHIGPKGAECVVRWCWSDALFMAPVSWIALSKATGDARYRRYGLDEFWATTNFLYDPAENLFYRDSRFFDRRDAAGRKEFWSRGNGWVFGGLARIIPMLPSGSPDRIRLEKLLRDMATRLVALQKPDGYWAPSLLSPEGSPPETSGTAFFTYGIAWGIKAGILDRKTFEPAAQRGWAALVRAVQPDGRLGYVQQVSDRPDHVEPSDTQFYGTGAFLMAAAAIADLAPAR